MIEKLKIKGAVSVTVKRANGTEEIVCKDNPNLLTTAGIDWIHGQVYAAGTTDCAKYIALSSNAGGAAIGHTSVAGEIVDGNGLDRAAGVVSHTPGTSVTTIAKTFTAAAVYTSVQLAGLLTASAVGTLVHENTFTPVNLEIADQIIVTWTITTS